MGNNVGTMSAGSIGLAWHPWTMVPFASFLSSLLLLHKCHARTEAVCAREINTTRGGRARDPSRVVRDGGLE